MKRPTHPASILTLSSLALCLIGADAQADSAGQWARCGVAEATLPFPARVETKPGAVHLQADQADFGYAGESTLSGDVYVQKDAQQLTADRVRYQTETEQVLVEGHLRYRSGGVYVEGDKARFDLGAQTGRVDAAEYQLTGSRGRGKAGTLAVDAQGETLKLQQATYSTCDPDDAAWLFSAESIALDRVKDEGVAEDVTIRFQDVPIFYAPTLSFPLSDKRKSGFLRPSFGSSDETGFEFTSQYYWNIAPERDATFGVRAMSQRGALLLGEYRYLLHDGAGKLAVEYLPDDNKQGGTRSLYSVEHEQRFTPNLRLNVDFQQASDRNYFDDLGTTLDVTSQRYLDRRMDITYTSGDWHLLGRVQGIQTVDESIAPVDEPYDRLPQLQLNYTPAENNRALNLTLFSEAVVFDRDVGVTGNRYHIEPEVSLPMRTPGSFVVPTVKLYHTQYQLSGQAAGLADDPSRTIPSASLDAGLIFERETRFAGNAVIQTLEPRLYYLYTAERNQSAIPDFDTGDFTFSFEQLFRDNRFSGIDRIADANQATVALTSRWLSARTGTELFRGSIGQIRYFRDREVQLPGNPAIQDSSSDIVAEFAGRFGKAWQARTGIQWNTDDTETERSSFQVRYQPDSSTVANLGYRRIRGRLEQVDLSARLPLTPNYAFIGRVNHELPESRILDSFAGIEYDSCCWAMRAVVRHFLNGDRTEHNTGVFFQLELKGLGGVGKRTGKLVRQQIPGYQNHF